MSMSEATEVLTGAVSDPVPMPLAEWLATLQPGLVPTGDVEKLLGVYRGEEVWQIRLNRLGQQIEAARGDLYVTTSSGELRILTDEEAVLHNLKAMGTKLRGLRSTIRKFARIKRAGLSSDRRRLYDVLSSYYTGMHFRIEREERNIARLPQDETITEIASIED